MQLSANNFFATHVVSYFCTSPWIYIHRKIIRGLLAIFWIALFPINGSAATIHYTPTFIGGVQWKYEYVVTTALGDPNVDEFSIFFDPALHANLSVATTPLGWDSLVIQPDTVIPADGLLDALALASGISAGTSLGGFAVLFDFLGTGTPGTQPFDIVDPTTFATIQTGFTSVAAVVPPTSDVPEPSALLLTGLAIALLLGFRSRFATSNRS